MLMAQNPGEYLAALGLLRIGGRLGWDDGSYACVEGLTEEQVIEAAMGYDPEALADCYAPRGGGGHLGGPYPSRIGHIESHPVLGRLYAGRQTVRGTVLALRDALRPEDLMGVLSGGKLPRRAVTTLRWDCTSASPAAYTGGSGGGGQLTRVGMDWLAVIGLPVLYRAPLLAPDRSIWHTLRYVTWREPATMATAQSVLTCPREYDALWGITRWHAPTVSLGTYHRMMGPAAPERMMAHV